MQASLCRDKFLFALPRPTALPPARGPLASGMIDLEMLLLDKAPSARPLDREVVQGRHL